MTSILLKSEVITDRFRELSRHAPGHSPTMSKNVIKNTISVKYAKCPHDYGGEFEYAVAVWRRLWLGLGM